MTSESEVQETSLNLGTATANEDASSEDKTAAPKDDVDVPKDHGIYASNTLTSSARRSAHALAVSKHFMPLFTHPHQRQRWGDSQLHPHKNWGDVFFDLFYVAA